ncbi:MAG: alkene reductase [Kofleriaceae bacterium]|nr:alkene reductase [Kofleriaceae bacterium]
MLLEPFTSPHLQLSNRIVMAPMTRSRATLNNTANSLIAKFYAQRASAGLLITEGTAPSPNGLGYARIPGLFAPAHVSGWGPVTDAVHREGGKIFVQLMHTGRVAALDNLPQGGVVVGPTDAPCPGKMFTDTAGMQPHSKPRAMTEADIAAAVQEYATACELAMDAGFDGVELHAANGYLLEQFLNANVNTRSDNYGGSADNRNRFTVEVAAACVQRIGAAQVGIRLSPYGVFNGTGAFDGVDTQYLALVKELSKLQLVYLHLLDHSAQGTPPVPAELKRSLRNAFAGVMMLCGGYTRDTAEADLQAGHADLIAFGRPFISNPDLVARFKTGVALSPADQTTFYTPGAKGYTDYGIASA